MNEKKRTRRRRNKEKIPTKSWLIKDFSLITKKKKLKPFLWKEKWLEKAKVFMILKLKEQNE